MKPDLHPAHSGETIQPRGPGRICPLSPRGRPTSAAARPPQCGLYWLPSAAASGLGIAVDLKDHDWRHNVGNHGLPDPRLKIMISQFSLWFSDRDIYIVEIDSIWQMCFDTFHPDKSQKKQLLQSYSSLMSAPASSFTQREDNVNQVWPYRIRSIRTTQHIYETTIIKPIPFILFHPDNFAQEKAAYHQTFSPPFTWLQLPTLSWGSCHCDPSPPAAVPPPRCGLPRPPSAAASDLGRARWVPHELGKWLGSFERFALSELNWHWWPCHCFCPIVQKCSKQFLHNVFCAMTEPLSFLSAVAMSSTSTPSNTHFCVQALS